MSTTGKLKKFGLEMTFMDIKIKIHGLKYRLT